MFNMQGPETFKVNGTAPSGFRIVMLRKDAELINAVAKEADPKEVSIVGQAERTGNIFRVYDLEVPKQECAGTRTEWDHSPEREDLNANIKAQQDAAAAGDTAKLEALQTAARETAERKSKTRFWWHSHVRMAPNPSGQDETQLAEFSKDQPFFIRMISNLNGVCTTSISLPAQNIQVDNAMVQIIDEVSPEVAAQAKELVTKNVRNLYSTVTTYGGYNGYNGGMYNRQTFRQNEAIEGLIAVRKLVVPAALSNLTLEEAVKTKYSNDVQLLIVHEVSDPSNYVWIDEPHRINNAKLPKEVQEAVKAAGATANFKVLAFAGLTSPALFSSELAELLPKAANDNLPVWLYLLYLEKGKKYYRVDHPAEIVAGPAGRHNLWDQVKAMAAPVTAAAAALAAPAYTGRDDYGYPGYE